MPLTTATTLSRHLASGLYRNMSEFVRTSAIYLGIAVLVATVMVFGMPGLRAQALQMHSALMYALAPDTFGPPPSALNAGPIGPLVGAISLDSIPESMLPPTGELQISPVRSPASQLAAPASPDSEISPKTTALAKAAEPADFKAAKTPAQALESMGVSRAQQEALIKYISRKYLVANDAAAMMIDTAFVVGSEFKIDPLLLLSVMATESRFNPYAGNQSGGPTGLMQVMLSVHRDKFAKYGRADAMAFNPVANVRVGATILSECVKQRGSISGGLLCYCGASSPSTDGGYTEKVLSERRRMALAASIALKD
ncbi:transglycosylase SLT domain-containing protein [Orrella sp. NBD-18]|uniref:Transglycosylase SLT domain-containing protein n=1 Tax=Sheuella amnicola TaxID=2707330 RepID=A0A6B2R1T9_9BURK|nr:lytic transglycosylase domain-containing protein [Sheuella amnicola]NDY82967.1 transglycosylase SLT domain-containing protein [Sheuella amnicola]HBI84088.1 lytic transglycosylase [Alcaligenaceae bacterium]